MPPRFGESDFSEYEGFLDPSDEDVGDETEAVDFAFYRAYAEKLAVKHNVSEDEVCQVFANSPKTFFRAKGSVPGEDVWIALGRTDGGRLLLVVYIEKKDGRLFIVSARDMGPKERRLYERK